MASIHEDPVRPGHSGSIAPLSRWAYGRDGVRAGLVQPGERSPPRRSRGGKLRSVHDNRSEPVLSSRSTGPTHSNRRSAQDCLAAHSAMNTAIVEAINSMAPGAYIEV